MTTWQSLLYCARADVTIERIADLVAVTGTEPMTVDFKESATPRVAECAAAMANTHGGLIFIGITDKDREIVGVPREVIANISGYFSTLLDPADWQPDTFEVPVGDASPGRYVIVVRINRYEAPRPVFVETVARFSNERRHLFCAPVRMPGGTRQATRDELEALYSEGPASESPDLQWEFHGPEIPRGPEGTEDPAVDFVMLSGLRVPVSSAAWGRPISQRVIQELSKKLDDSALAKFLFRLAGLPSIDVDLFHQEGQGNRSNMATLVRRIAPAEQPVPFEITARVEVPGQYGRSHVLALELTLTLVSRLSAWQVAGYSSQPPPRNRRLDVSQWAELLDSMADTLTSQGVLGPVADLAGVDPITIRQPRVLHVRSGPLMAELLPAQLVPIRGGGPSYGAHMLADPALDLSSRAERADQVDMWLTQMGLDAGLLGMERLVRELRRSRAS
jgi:hypothetical protein